MLEQLSEKNLLEDPVEQFRIWFRDAEEHSGMERPNAACLSTVGTDGYPEGRIVLLKSFDARGFVFFTNYDSRKGRALSRVPRAALTFHWDNLMRQIRVQGEVEKTEPEVSDAYFASRPRGSNLSAAASAQSEPIDAREALERRIAELEKKLGDAPVPRPPHWGGFRIIPREFEFWQCRDDRVHDRFLFRRDPVGAWAAVRLQP